MTIDFINTYNEISAYIPYQGHFKPRGSRIVSAEINHCHKHGHREELNVE